MKTTLRIAIVLVCAPMAGCALLGKGDVHVARYFTPEYESSTQPRPAKNALRLRLGQVGAYSHLRERMVVRHSMQELVFSEDVRWTQSPEVYLRRALSRALFEERGVVQVMSGNAVTLEVELIAFEELAGQDEVRLQALIVLHDERQGLMEETITVKVPVPEAAAEKRQRAVVEALSQALHTAVTQTADRVVARLAAVPARPNP